MNQKQMAISSLIEMKHYYQSRYEYYLAMATASKENRERVELLIEDLSGSDETRRSFWSDEFRSNNSPEYFVNPSEFLSHTREKENLIFQPPSFTEQEGKQVAEIRHTEVQQDATQTAETISLCNRAVEIIASIAQSEAGKTLHLNYFQKLLEQQMSLPLSEEIVWVYLDEGVKRGYLDKDRFDPQCYIALVEAKTETASSENSNSSSDKSHRRKQTRPYNLPPSPKLREILVETIQEYIEQTNAHRFSITDVIDYLYSEKERESWSSKTKNKVRSCISNLLSRKAYLNKYWKRVKPGLYQAIA